MSLFQGRIETVLTFGDRPAPAMAITAMRKTAKLNQDAKPKAAKAILNNAYVDDICDSAVDPNEAKTLIADIDEVLASGGFQVKKWTSNVTLDSKENSEEIALGGETYTEKVLGTVWLPKEDKFSFKIRIESDSMNWTYNDSYNDLLLASPHTGLFRTNFTILCGGL